MLLDHNHPKYYDLLCSHICDNFMFDYVKILPQKVSRFYWGNINRIDIRDFDTDCFKLLLENLFQAENYETAFRMLSIRIDYEEVDRNLVIQALLQYASLQDFSDIKTVSSSIFAIREVVNYILKSSEPEEVLSEIEEKYIRFLDLRYKAKYVFFKMANDPQYVEKLLLRRHQHEKEAEYNSSEAYLFSKFKVTPGYKSDGSFDYSDYLNWFEFASKSELSDEMMRIFAANSYHADAIEEDEFFMNRKVIEFIEDRFDNDLMTVFEVEALNSVGIIDLDPERHAHETLSQEFEKKAEWCEIEGYIKTSRVYRSIANMMLLRAKG